MAGDWLPIRLDLWDDPRIVRIDRALGCGRAAAVGACVRLWAAADNYSEDGTLAGYDAETVDNLVGIAGFARALESVGWLTIKPDAVTIPEFEKWSSCGAKRRLNDNRRKAQARKLSASKADKSRTKAGPQASGQKPGPQDRRVQKRTEQSEVGGRQCARGDARGDAGHDWAALVSEVFDVGVNDAAAAVYAAQSRGATPADVRELMTFWAEAPERWSFPEAALYRRLTRWQRGQPIADGWERPSADYERAQRCAASMAKLRDEAQRVAALRDRSEAEREACRAGYREMVAANGGLLDRFRTATTSDKR